MTPLFAFTTGSASAKLSGRRKGFCEACVGSLFMFWRFADALIKRLSVSNNWVARLVGTGVVVSNGDASKLKRAWRVNSSLNSSVSVFPLKTYLGLFTLTHLTESLRSEKRNACN